jgi:hypothetical protein
MTPQQNDTQRNDTEHKVHILDTQHNTQHNSTSVHMVKVIMLGVANAKFSLLKLLIYEPYYLP